MKYGAGGGREEGWRKKEDKNMEGRSRVRRHEITKNGIDVEIRDPYRYRSVPLSFDRYIAESARETAFFFSRGRMTERTRKIITYFGNCCFRNIKLWEIDIMYHINGTFLKHVV